MINDGICYLVLTDKAYPKRLAFLFLEEVIRARRLDHWVRPDSSSNLKKLNDDLALIQNVIRKTIDDMLYSGIDVLEISKNFASESKQFKWRAKQLSAMALFKQYAPFIALGVVVFIILPVKYMF